MTDSSVSSYRQIPLTQGYFALVDDDDFERVNQFKWHIHRDRKGSIEAKRTIAIGNPQRFQTVSMSRYIMGIGVGDKRRVEHLRPSATLDNRKSNLRLVSYESQSKACSREDCHLKGVLQPLSRFHKNKAMKLGVASQCKDCDNRMRRNWEKRNPNKVAAANERKRISPKSKQTMKSYRLKPENFDKAQKKQRAWAENNKSRIRLNSLQKRFRRQGVTQEWYEGQLMEQDFKCGICGEECPPISSRRLAIDHNHSCCPDGRACDKCRRGLLCAKCNTRLGIIEDRKWVDKASRYLSRWS